VGEGRVEAGFQAIAAGDWPGARDPVESEALARQAAEIRRASGNADLELMAMHAVGQALVQQGKTDEGMSLLDEAMAGVVGGEGRDPLTVAQMSCMTMVVCGCT